MITTRFYLDCRRVESGMVAPLRVVLTKNGVRALVNIGFSILPSQWDAKRQIVIGHPCKHQFNSLIMERKLAVDSILYRLETSGKLAGLKAGEIKSMVEAELFPDRAPRVTFISRYDAFAEAKSEGTRRIYRVTRRRLEDFVGHELGTLTFEQMDVAWLKRFDAFLAKTSPARNARNIHFRNIRAVFNDALSDEVITCYPFRKFKLTPEPTRKRALTVEKLRAVFDAQVKPHEVRYRDFFKLTFLLCGNNVVDLCRLGPDAVVDNRVEYQRAKTHRLYSIKLEPEAEDLIAKYAGKDWLLNYHDGCKSYRAFYKRACQCIREIGKRLGIDGLSSYWARHSWATIASSLDIPKETIAAALYNQQTQNATTSLLDLLDTFNEFVRDAAYKDVKNIQQFYDQKRVFNIAGRVGTQIEYDPRKIRDVEFDMSIVPSTATPAYRAMTNDFLLQLFNQQAISLEQLLQAGNFPFADELLQSIQSQKEQLEAGQIPDGVSPQLLAQAQQGANMDAVNQLQGAMRGEQPTQQVSQ